MYLWLIHQTLNERGNRTVSCHVDMCSAPKKAFIQAYPELCDSPNDDLRAPPAPTCVASGMKNCSVHHVDGDRYNNHIANLTAFALDRHNRLKRIRNAGSVREMKRIDRDNRCSLTSDYSVDELVHRAEKLYASGALVRAYACMRLAYGLQRYFFMPELDREIELGFRTLRLLRRSAAAIPAAVRYQLLQYHLVAEIKPALEQPQRTSLKSRLYLHEELGSWLNEQGHAHRAFPIISSAVNLSAKLNLEPGETSRLYRQYAWSILLKGYGEIRKFEELLTSAGQFDPGSVHNKYAILTTMVPSLFALRDYPGALRLVEPALEEIEAKTHRWKQMDWNRIGVSVPTTLGFLGQSALAIAACSDRRSERRILRLIALIESKEKETIPVANTFCDLFKDAGLAFDSRFPQRAGFFAHRMCPKLPVTMRDTVSDVAGLLR